MEAKITNKICFIKIITVHWSRIKKLFGRNIISGTLYMGIKADLNGMTNYFNKCSDMIFTRD